MNFRMILKQTGKALSTEAMLMILPLILCFFYDPEEAVSFIIPMVLIAGTSIPCYFIKTEGQQIFPKEGFAIVALSWILISFFGAMPYYLCGGFDSFVDCFFESISGFTTTGATVLNNVESLSKPILFWRSLTLWIGGMGVLVLMLALLPVSGGHAFHIMKAESPGPSPGKLVPRLADSSKILYVIYTVMTLILFLVLLLLKMPAFDAITTAFSAAGTGGFSVLNGSIGGYNNPLIEVAVGIAIFVFGINFALIFFFIKKEFTHVKEDEELRFYFAIVAISTLLITLNLVQQNIYTLTDALRHAFFQVSSVVTTTGFTTADFDLWPPFAKSVLFILLFSGGSSGSTSGAIKCIRTLIVIKIVHSEISKIIHPRAVNTVKINSKPLPEQVARGALIFVIAYLLIFIVSALIVGLNGFDLETTFSSVAMALGNVGIGFSKAGPSGSFYHFSPLSKMVLSFCMLVGRLEIFPIILLFMPAFWKKVNI